VALALALLCSTCGTPSSTARADLRAYVQASKAWAAVEGETARTLDRILETQFVDEAEVLRQIADSRPRIAKHLELIRAYTPATDDLRRIHERYVAAWETLLGGYDAIERGFRTGDYTNLARGREAMATWRDAIVGVARDLRELMRRFGVDATAATES
jgi:hypothetical protein